MYLKSLELTGFKSFAEAKIEFPTGITAVVGPNGTGKSNVVDALLWVLGEQSTKTLRSERMEDVIFNGTEIRKPLGMAEVSLIMSGIEDLKLDGIPALPNQLSEYHEVMVTRRLYRNGDSEYLINKTPCRLKDIRSLFLDTRAGSRGHTVIEQGRIEQILNASPQDRRELIEETAGIVRYKKQKAEALRKLESTHHNLLRVRDIIAEVRRQLNSLERQARQARLYQSLQQEARTLEIRLLAREYRALHGSHAVVEAELAVLGTKEASQMAEHGRLSCDLEEARLRMTAADQSVQRIREELAVVEQQQTQAVAAVEVERGRLGLYEQQRAVAGEELARLGLEREQAIRDMSELRARLSKGETDMTERACALTELEEAAQLLAARRTALGEEEGQARRTSLAVTVQVTNEENVLTGLDGRQEDARRRAERLAGEQAEIEAQRAAAFERLREVVQSREDGERQQRELQQRHETAVQESGRLDERLREADRLISRQQEELAAVDSRLQALQGIIREEMGYGREGESEAASLRAACRGVREAVAEWLVVPPGLERAIEAVLGERMRAWLVEGPSHARPAIEFLKTRGLGRGAFVPVRPRWVAESVGRHADGWWPGLKGTPGVVGRVRDLVRASSEPQDPLACLFDRVVIVETLDVAVRLWELGLWSAPEGPTLVTLEGEVLDAAGIITGGTTGESGGLLQRRREIQELELKRRALADAIEDLRRNRERLSVESEASQADGQRLDETIREAEMRALAFAKDETNLGQDVEELDRRIETIRTERLAGEEERTRIEGEIESARERLSRAVEEKSGGEARLAELSHALLGMEEETCTLQQRMLEARLAVAELRASLEHGKADLARLVRAQEERGARANALDQHITSLTEAVRQSQAEQDRNQALFRELERRAAQIRGEFVSAQAAQARDVEASRQIERDLETVRDALESSRSTRTAVEVRRAELKTQLTTLESTLTGTYQLSVADALAQGPEKEETAENGPPEEMSLEIRDRLQKLRDRLARMGAVNLAAIEEHRELEERHRFLTTQEEDLSNSIHSLKEIISKINRTTKQMFLDTFNELQQKFGEVFTRFFPGGRAELVLTEPEEGPEPGQGTSPEPGLDVVAQPPGKRLKSIAMLSGGEKTLTAMALIFASFLIRPTPFCILDEIDAPLDEENIGRFTGVLRELSEGAQFVVITHNKRTMAMADSLFGVTMEEPGVSKLVSVRLADLQPA
ncbi:MAG: chromosome segregation protein SMC [Nitrospirae bacterium]|nr:chromosome segregation protein SMC [Nitrospirota bacterium]